MSPIFTKSTTIDATPAEQFAWHERPGAFQRLAPPWASVELLRHSAEIRDGGGAAFRIRSGPMPIPLHWEATFRDCVPGERFVDVQTRGPFAKWEHAHECLPQDGDATRSVLRDTVDYKLPLGPLGAFFGGGFVRRDLERAFAYRHATTAGDLAAHAAARLAPKRVLVSGSTGLIGSALCPFLATGGHDVVALTRKGSLPARGALAEGTSIAWNPADGFEEAGLGALEGFDAVVHLAGANIATRWTKRAMRDIHESRANDTRKLCEALAKLKRKPAVLIAGSATGVYGERGDEELFDDAAPAWERGVSDFRSEVCRAWEEATTPAREAGIRVVNLRTGVVLSPRGGALGKMLLPFLLGGGGPLGDGKQWFSWISIDDILGAILHAIANDSLEGPVNAVAPEPVRQRDFAKTLGRVLRRPAFAPMPRAIVSLLFGQMGREVLLSSQRVAPARLAASGFAFRHARLEEALRHVLGRRPATE
jgi:uncharacterized protein (TIGR01777 family)